jgi:hypothetical protein
VTLSVHTLGMWRCGVLMIPLALVTWLLTGCGNTVTVEVIGMAAVAQSGDGSPVLLVKVCKDNIDTISVFASRKGLSADQPNPLVASWTSDHPVSGTIQLSIEQPGAGWRPGPSTPAGLTFGLAQGYVVLAQSSQQDAEVTQVSFRGRALHELKPGQVLVRNSHIWSRERFEREACPHNQG